MRKRPPSSAQAAQYAYETYGLTPVFAAVEKHLDPVAGRLAAAGLDIPHYFLDDAGSAGTIIGALSRMQAVVSMRLHALIFAAGQGIPSGGRGVRSQGLRLPAVYRAGELPGSETALTLECPQGHDRPHGQLAPCLPGGTGRRRAEAAADQNRSTWTRPAAYLGNKPCL